MEDNGVFMTWHRKESSGSDPICVVPEVPIFTNQYFIYGNLPMFLAPCLFRKRSMTLILRCLESGRARGATRWELRSKPLGWPRWSWKNGPQTKTKKNTFTVTGTTSFFEVLVYMSFFCWTNFLVDGIWMFNNAFGRWYERMDFSGSCKGW